jgi:hypothetical protein
LGGDPAGRSCLAELAGDDDGKVVARAADVSRAWLNRENDIHAAIVSLRTAGPQATPGVPAAQRKSMESLREQLNAARTEITRLKSDNTAMRNEVPRAFWTVHPIGWAGWKGELIAQTEEELLTGIQG